MGVVKAQGLRWMGHMGRMVKSIMPKIIMARTVGRKKRIGRHSGRWKTEVERDKHVKDNEMERGSEQ